MKKLLAMLALSALATGCSYTGEQLKVIAQAGAQLGSDLVELGPKLVKDGKAFVNAVTGKASEEPAK